MFKKKEKENDGEPKKSFMERRLEQGEGTVDLATVRARAKYLNRWMAMSGVDSPDMIDYTKPQIEIEFMLCDMRNLKLIRGGKNRDEFLKQLSPEARECYLYETDKDGHSYRDLENPHVWGQFVRSMGLLVMGSKRAIPKELRKDINKT